MRLYCLSEASPRRGKTSDTGIPDTVLRQLAFENHRLSLKQLSKMQLKFLPTIEDFNQNSKDYLNTIERYAAYTIKNGLESMPPIRFMDGRLEDGGHRINTIFYLALKDGKKWLNKKLPVRFYKTKINWKELEKKDPAAFMNKQRAARYIIKSLKE